ncbi:MAG: CoB--CoM heterodisulfide reductase iron-sulfur subunit B family protein [Pseudomonadota bacterium]
MNDFTYFPGCSLHATAREYDESLRAVAREAGLSLREIKDWCCCGATPAHALDPKAAEILGRWNLAQATKAGKSPVLTGCASCFSRLRAVREKTDLAVLHIAQVLNHPEMREKLAAKIRKPLQGLKVACYYGCLLTRPRGEDAVDDAENPRILEDLVRLTGAEAVDWPLRLDCCGASMALPRPDLVRELSGKILTMAHERGADVVMVACPLCHSNLDFQQEAALKGRDFRIPIVYLTQLIGLALGIPVQKLGLQRHFVPVPAKEWLKEPAHV